MQEHACSSGTSQQLATHACMCRCYMGLSPEHIPTARACAGCGMLGCSTWLRYTEGRRLNAARLAHARLALQRARLQRLLPAWRVLTGPLQQRRCRKELAQQHAAECQARRLLLTWRANAAESARDQEQLARSDRHHAASLLQRGMQGWCWYGW